MDLQTASQTFPALSAKPAHKSRLWSIFGGSMGNLVEWYDCDVSTAQLLNAAAIVAVGFLMRPLGAWPMGMYADRKGRKAGLT
ncbi:hypothetical protein E4T56_gene8617, partial [Termitomyces sp. T112]